MKKVDRKVDRKAVRKADGEGILEGIRATVRTCRNFNISETDTVRNIMNEFSLSQEEAVNYVKKILVNGKLYQEEP